MPLVDAIRQEFDQEAPITRRVLERVPIEKADWTPHPKSMSLGRLASWMANAPGWVAQVLHEDGIDFANWEPFQVPVSAAALLTTFDEGNGAVRVSMERLDDAAAKGDWRFRMGDRVLGSYPRIGFLRLFLLSDAIHHRGQMSVFLRLLGVPVPAIYGPSADENPFS